MGDGFFILLALVALALVVGTPILVIVMLVQFSTLRARLDRLEARVRGIGTGDPLPVRTGLSPSAEAPAPAAPIPEPSARPPEAAPGLAGAGPWNAAEPVEPKAAMEPEPDPLPDQNRPLVLRADRFAALALWLRENWVLAVAAVSLALAGVFFVQYGIERGLLPPPARVAAGILFGLALIAGGEAIRRRAGDAGAAYLPSALSGAGLAAIFAAVAAGRMMYGLYGPGPTFAGLFTTSAGAVLLGWRHGPLLVAIGLIGAAAAPFLVAGGSGAQPWLYGHYLLVAAVGLAVDAWRRWAWVSVLALVLGHLGLFLMMQGGAGAAGWLLAQAALVILAIALPERSPVPRHEGPAVATALWRRDGIWPGFAVRLAAGNTLAASLQLTLLADRGTEGLLALIVLAGLALLLLLWATQAEGLDDLALLPAAGFLTKLALAAPLIGAWSRQAIELRPPETSAPLTATLILALAAVVSAAAAWRSLRNGTLAHALGAVVVAPVAAGILETLWHPSTVLGAYVWALHVMALAAGAVWLAVAFARADGGPRRRSAWATLAALSLIALALFVLTSAAALTLALAVLLVVAVALDRRFSLPEMGWFVQFGAAMLSWRLVIDPGIPWAQETALPSVILAYLGVAAACLAGLRLLPEERPLPKAVLESLGLAAPALLVNALLLRALTPDYDAGVWGPDLNATHWGAALHALPWLVIGGAQLWRAGAARGFGRRLRLGIAAGAGLLAGWGLTLAATAFNPLIAWHDDPEGRVWGPPILDTLALAYALPGLLLVLVPPRLTVLPAPLRLALRLAGAALLVLYAVTEIRRLWHGPWIGGSEVMQGELYSYTLALLVTGAVLLWQAIARRSPGLQRIAMAVIALTVAKVFLWDASGLTGLVRVLSFAGLGLSLAGLAWLNAWARRSMGPLASGPRGP